MANPLLALPVALHLIAALSAGVPNLDVRPSCNAAAAVEMTATNTMQSCLSDEQNARDQLVKSWTEFNSTDRAICVRTTMNFDPAYTELLTCLEMANDARKLPTNL
jgi:hypothetical protein